MINYQHKSTFLSCLCFKIMHVQIKRGWKSNTKHLHFFLEHKSILKKQFIYVASTQKLKILAEYDTGLKRLESKQFILNISRRGVRCLKKESEEELRPHRNGFQLFNYSIICARTSGPSADQPYSSLIERDRRGIVLLH